jgi:hypothetical protein
MAGEQLRFYGVGGLPNNPNASNPLANAMWTATENQNGSGLLARATPRFPSARFFQEYPLRSSAIAIESGIAADATNSARHRGRCESSSNWPAATRIRTASSAPIHNPIELLRRFARGCSSAVPFIGENGAHSFIVSTRLLLWAISSLVSANGEEVV